MSVVFNLQHPLDLTQSYEVGLRNDESPMDGDAAESPKGLGGLLETCCI